MKHFHSSKGNSSSTSHEIPRILRTTEVHYRVLKIPHLFLSWARQTQSTLCHPT